MICVDVYTIEINSPQSLVCNDKNTLDHYQVDDEMAMIGINHMYNIAFKTL